VPLVARRPDLDGDLLRIDVGLLEIVMAPVLEDDVDVAALEALPRDLLLEVLLLDRVAELGLEEIPDHRGICLVADPRVDRDVDRSLRAAGPAAGRSAASGALARRSRRRGRRSASATAACAEDDRGDGDRHTQSSQLAVSLHHR